MRRPRIKCALCGKRRVAPHGIESVRWLAGHKIHMHIKWTVDRWICEKCNNKLGQLMFAGLWEKI